MALRFKINVYVLPKLFIRSDREVYCNACYYHVGLYELQTKKLHDQQKQT